MTTRTRHARSRRRGHTAVEAAIVINLLFVVLLGVFEYGRLIMVRQLMDNAAREGARTGVVNTGSTSSQTTAQIQATVTSYMSGVTYNNLVVQVFEADPTTGANLGTWSSTPYGYNVGVQVDADFVPLFPLFGGLPNALHLTSRSMMRSEAN